MACGSLEGPRHAVYEVTAEPSLRGLCDSSAARWEAATGLVIACDAGPPLAYGTPPEGYGGWKYPDGSIVISPEFKGNVLSILVTHELGHLIRSGHPDYGGLMCWASSPKNALTSVDLAWACEAADCTWFQPEGEDLRACPEEP
jgi:hypothetical protein